MKTITELKEKVDSEGVEFISINPPTQTPLALASIFEWIKQEALTQGLTVELKSERIIFIKGQDKL